MIMGNFIVYWERIITDEDKALLKKLIGKKRLTIGFSNLYATLDGETTDRYNTCRLVGQGAMMLVASSVETEINSPIMQFDIWYPAFLKPHYTSGQQPARVSCQYFPTAFWWQHNSASFIYPPDGSTLSEVALIYMESRLNSYDITTRETLLKKITGISKEISEQEIIPATFSHLTEVWRILTYIVLIFKDNTRFFIEFTDNPYGYEITYCDNTSGMWEKIVEAIDDDTGLKMYTVDYV